MEPKFNQKHKTELLLRLIAAGAITLGSSLPAVVAAAPLKLGKEAAPLTH